MEVRSCWICFQSEEESEFALIQPCRCIGNMKWVHGSCINSWLNKSQGTARPSCRFCGASYRFGLPDLPLAHRLLEEAERLLYWWPLTLLLGLLTWHSLFSVLETESMSSETERESFLRPGAGAIISLSLTIELLVLSYGVVLLGAVLVLLSNLVFQNDFVQAFALQVMQNFAHYFVPSVLRRRIGLPPAVGSLEATRRFMLIVCLIACDWMDFHDGETPLWVAATTLSSLALSYYHCYRVLRRNTSVSVLPFIVD